MGTNNAMHKNRNSKTIKSLSMEVPPEKQTNKQTEGSPTDHTSPSLLVVSPLHTVEKQEFCRLLMNIIVAKIR